jgi:hypothetical protein
VQANTVEQKSAALDRAVSRQNEQELIPTGYPVAPLRRLTFLFWTLS